MEDRCKNYTSYFHFIQNLVKLKNIQHPSRYSNEVSPPFFLHKPRLEITKAIIHDPCITVIPRLKEGKRERESGGWLVFLRHVQGMRPEGDENLADDSSFYVSPRSTRLRIGSSGCTARIWREEIKAWGEREGRMMLWRREREREPPLSNGFTRWVRWWNSPLKWFYWRAWGATTSRREGSKVWPTHPRPEERKEGCLSPLPSLLVP